MGKFFSWLTKLWGSLMSARDAKKPLMFTLTKEIRITGYEMKKMKLIRKIYTNNSTIGKFSFNDFECWMLEPPSRKVEGDVVCIPSGTYKMEWRWSNAHNMFLPGLLKVPGRSDIEIHPGNYPKDTKGCFLPGDGQSVDYVSNSRATCKKLFPLIEKAIGEGDLFFDVIG